MFDSPSASEMVALAMSDRTPCPVLEFRPIDGKGWDWESVRQRAERAGYGQTVIDGRIFGLARDVCTDHLPEGA